MFSNDPPVNSTLDSVVQVRKPDGSFEITLTGRLINLSMNGSLTFRVDPAGTFVTGTMSLCSRAAAAECSCKSESIPALTPLGLVALAALMTAAAAAVMLRRKRRPRAAS
jgi:hypothetical protein